MNVGETKNVDREKTYRKIKFSECQMKYVTEPEEVEIGFFHKWGVSHEEYCDERGGTSTGAFNVAIIEKYDGSIIEKAACCVQFV